MSEAVTDYHGLVDAMRALKAQIGLSNALVDELCGWTSGQCDKLLGPSSTRLIGAKLLMDLIWVLGAELEVRPNLDRMNEMAAHWERRAEANVTRQNRISKRVMESARPAIFRENAKRGGIARHACLPAKQASRIARKGGHARRRSLTRMQRSEIARKAARARWDKLKAENCHNRVKPLAIPERTVPQ